MNKENNLHVNALIVRQWLEEWNNVLFSEEKHRRTPEPQFFLFTLSALQLRKLSKVYQRKADRPRAQDMSVQRTLERPRAEEIGRFIHGGYPWSELNDNQKKQDEFSDLRMPGWLPTAIVANILPVGAKRDGSELSAENAIMVELVDNSMARLILPEGFLNDDWDPDVPPLEIIDGQHRLYSFENTEQLDGDFDLPVVAFNNLDFTWQAYLFYTINIKPKKINTSLAYDLYPLLRIQDWLEKAQNGPAVYRETRAQELTEILWSHPESPWRGRINMLGEKKGGDVTQAAFVRSLLSSYVKRGAPIGGLFGDELHTRMGDLLQWNRIKQGAFLIAVWQAIQSAVLEMDEPWMQSLRSVTRQENLPLPNADQTDLAFSGPYSLLATDQGVRGVLQVTNDMCFIAADILKLSEWVLGESTISDMNDNAISESIETLKEQPVYSFLKKVAQIIVKFDWRVSSTPKLDEETRRGQMVYKGSSGYKEMRLQLLRRLCDAEDQAIAKIAKRIRGILKY